MEKIIILDKEFWKYFWLCAKDSYNQWLEHFEGWKKVTEPIGVAITTALLTLFSQRIYNGVLKMSDVNIAIISIICAPIVWAAFVYLLKLIFAPFRLYKQQSKELKKYNLDDVYFSLVKYSIPHATGWAIRIENKKGFDLDETLLEVKQVLIDEMYVLHTDNQKTLYYLKFIDNLDRLTKIVGSWHAKDSAIKSGDHRDFILTKNTDEFCFEFECHPYNLNIFDNGELESYRNSKFPILLKIEFKAVANIEDESWVIPSKLPFKMLCIQENKDGSFDWA